MSKQGNVASIVVEWSPTKVTWIGGGHAVHTGDSLRDLDLPGKEIVVAVSRRTAFIRPTRVPNTSKGDIRRILQVQIGNLFPVAASELAFDFHLTPDVNSEGRLAILAAVRSADLDILQGQAKEAGLRITRIVPAAFAAPLLAKSLQMQDAAIVHRTVEGLAIDLVAGGELRYSRVASLPPTAAGIDSEISRTFAAAVLSPSPILAAGSLALPGADVSTDTWAVELLTGAQLDVNLETAEQIAARDSRSERSKLQLASVAFLAAAAFFGWQAMRYSKSASQVAATNTDSNQRISKVQMVSDAANAQANKSNATRLVLDRAFHPGQSLADVLAVSTNNVPKGLWLTGFLLDRGKPLTLRGTATGGNAVTTYQNALIDQSEGEQKRFRDVKLVFQTDSELEKTPVVQFSISAFPVGNLPKVDITAKKTGQKS